MTCQCGIVPGTESGPGRPESNDVVEAGRTVFGAA